MPRGHTTSGTTLQQQFINALREVLDLEPLYGNERERERRERLSFQTHSITSGSLGDGNRRIGAKSASKNSPFWARY
jgi:hypothetical protein